MSYIYLSTRPSPVLSRYIDDLYYWNGPSPFPMMKVVPIPTLHLMVNLGEAFQVYKPEQVKPLAVCRESWVVGLWDSYHTVHWPARVEFYGIHFKAGGIYPFLGFPLSELHNQVVALDALWGHFAGELREQLAAVPSVEAGFALLEQLLLTRLRAPLYGLEIIHYAVARIARQAENLSIKTLSEHIGISQNHLGNQFKKMVGLPPKMMLRLSRFAQVYFSIESPTQPIDWAELALQSGYYDQSHFNKDFLAFSGHTPTEHLRLLRQLHNVDPEHQHLPRPLPTD